MPLYPYQNMFYNNLRLSLGKYQQIIGCSATGSGKTKVFVQAAIDAHNKGFAVLVLTESLKIFKQIEVEIPDSHLIDRGADKMLFIGGNSVSVGMVQTLIRRPIIMGQFKALGRRLFVITDECHMGTFNKVLDDLVPGCLLMGFTATPDARFAKHLPKYYKTCVVGPQPDELINLGYLCPYDHFARVSADLNLLSLQKGEFTEESQERAFETAKVFEGLNEDLRTIPFKKCMIYCASIRDCELLFQQMFGAGFNVCRYHTNRKLLSETEATYGLGQFMHGDIDICISVGTLTKGYDFPPIDLIVLRRATMSLSLYLQMIGRGSRTWNEKSEGFIIGVHEVKKKFTVLDYGGNYMRHGLWYADREWETMWNQPRKPKDGVAPVKICPNCEYILPIQAMTCINCGYEFIKAPPTYEEGQLIHITELYNNLCVGKKIGSLSAEGLSIYAKLKNKKLLATRIAKARNLEKEGYLKDFAECMGYRPAWVDHILNTLERDERGQIVPVSFPNFELK